MNILFDNDGTLYSDLESMTKLIKKSLIGVIAEKLGITEQEAVRERQRLIEKYSVESTEFVFAQEYGIPPSDFISRAYLLPEGILKEDKRLQKMLQGLAQRKSILTNNPSEFAEQTSKALGIRGYFQHIIGSREMGYHLKPDLRAFQRAVEITGYDPRQTVFVDDIPDFHIAAKELGMTTVLVGNKQKNSSIDYHISQIYDLEAIL